MCVDDGSSVDMVTGVSIDCNQPHFTMVMYTINSFQNDMLKSGYS